MKNTAIAVLLILASMFLLVLCCIVGAVSAIVMPIYFMCKLACYLFKSFVAPVAQQGITTVKVLAGLPYPKEVVFEIDQDLPEGIKLSDIADGQRSEYKGVDLRDVLQYTVYDRETKVRVFQDSTPTCLISSSGRYFFGYGDTLYSVQYHPNALPSSSLFRRMLLPCGRVGKNVIVLKTNFAVTGPRTNDVTFEYAMLQNGITRMKLIAPSVLLNKTAGMTPTRLALLSPYVVSNNCESIFLRRYIALTRARVGGSDGEFPVAVMWDMRTNMQQFMHILTYARGALSLQDARFLRDGVRFIQSTRNEVIKYGAAARAKHEADVLLLLGLSQSDDAIFKPITEKGKLWVISEFICSQQFQNAVISASMASVKDSISNGMVSREDILEGVPYLCKQIPGLFEIVYVLVKAAVCGTYEEGCLNNLVLHNIRGAMRFMDRVMPDVDAGPESGGVDGGVIRDFNALKEKAVRASELSHGGNVRNMYTIGKRILRSERCSDIIACVVAHRVSSLWDSVGQLVHDLCAHATSDELITDYLQTDSALRNYAFRRRGAGLELADRQECEISSDVGINVCKLPILECPTPASDTSLDNPEVAAAVGPEPIMAATTSTGAVGTLCTSI
ncbi:hypothetical protein F0Q53_00080 [Anaplasma marginale]|uniref:Uncharacterized protein n=2 Tax=Anaplasma marginale TaxID=770 RepID=A0A643CN17_ANAMA|nr:hypothetical protein [Anaplasma marginale]AXW84541.1 hypothetical protein CQZ76_02105 [Anaplasma marginale]AXW85474.1 hypothetical protein BKM88_02100 [Anaplasma marginale]KAA8473185.1 hypothetical protein F0Q58_00885 [Anaplasma marginale]KAA8475208.1 hypothetical protein F0Q53_00080 [Anaplasma marginale]KAB0451547.1 hypothetical protein FY210_00890 [Anaplasma marginale]